MSVIEGTGEKNSVLSEVWKPTYDFRTVNIQQKMAEPPPTFKTLQALLQRGKTPFSDEIRVTVEVQGIYALPEEWTSKFVSPNL
jgi:hypothetical protein